VPGKLIFFSIVSLVKALLGNTAVHPQLTLKEEREAHEANELLPIDCTVVGTTNDDIAVNWKVKLPILFKKDPSSKLIDVNEVHNLKALEPIDITCGGISIEVIAVPWNAKSPILIGAEAEPLVANVTEDKDTTFWNASEPIEFTVEAITIDFNVVQPLYAPAAILVAPSSMVTRPSPSGVIAQAASMNAAGKATTKIQNRSRRKQRGFDIDASQKIWFQL
jgi:hypothetical protein